jgi:predicted phosphohydrolase
MPTFRLASDLHIEVLLKQSPEAISQALRQRIPVMDGEKDQILLIPGDIVTLYAMEVMLPYFIDLSLRFKHVCYLPGNHEYWYANMKDVWQKMVDMIQAAGCYNFSFMNNTNQLLIADFDDVRVIGTTLWTDFNAGNPQDMAIAARYMVDYQVTKVGTNMLTPGLIYALHQYQRKNLFAEISQAKIVDQKKVLVMTHHLPLLQSIHPRYAGQAVNSAFASDLSIDVSIDTPEVWVHGHTHDALDYVHTTKAGKEMHVLCNPFGYTAGDNGYNPHLVFTM